MFKEMLQKLFSTQYLFGAPSTSLTHTDFYIYYVGAVSIGLGIILFFLYRLQRNPVRRGLFLRWTRLSFWIGVLLALWFWSRYELVNFFSTHIVAVAVVLIAIVWLGYILKYQFGKYRMKLGEFEREQIKKKYM